MSSTVSSALGGEILGSQKRLVGPRLVKPFSHWRTHVCISHSSLIHLSPHLTPQILLRDVKTPNAAKSLGKMTASCMHDSSRPRILSNPPKICTTNEMSLVLCCPLGRWSSQICHDTSRSIHQFWWEVISKQKQTGVFRISETVSPSQLLHLTISLLKISGETQFSCFIGSACYC